MHIHYMYINITYTFVYLKFTFSSILFKNHSRGHLADLLEGHKVYMNRLLLIWEFHNFIGTFHGFTFYQAF